MAVAGLRPEAGAALIVSLRPLWRTCPRSSAHSIPWRAPATPALTASSRPRGRDSQAEPNLSRLVRSPPAGLSADSSGQGYQPFKFDDDDYHK